ncbi:MAG TPA: DinB family protein [Tepidisphaeraceae bacterium]|nr:DinB family protein [Tepidisphaeraceae bacterium]
MNCELIDQYEKGGDDLRMAVRGLAREDLVAFPVPGTWSIQQIVLHLMDSDLILADRMKRVIAEDNPSLIGYDESKFVKNLFYHEQSVEDAVNLFEMNRRNFARVLKKLPDAAFDRVGTHNERGPLKLSDLLSGAVNHLKHHLKFIVDKREKLGKMMW